MQRHSRKSIGRWSIHHPWHALAVWIAFVLACLTLGAISGTKTLGNGAVGKSARGYAIMNKYRLWGQLRRLDSGLRSARRIREVACRSTEASRGAATHAGGGRRAVQGQTFDRDPVGGTGSYRVGPHSGRHTRYKETEVLQLLHVATQEATPPGRVGSSTRRDMRLVLRCGLLLLTIWLISSRFCCS